MTNEQRAHDIATAIIESTLQQAHVDNTAKMINNLLHGTKDESVPDILEIYNDAYENALNSFKNA